MSRQHTIGFELGNISYEADTVSGSVIASTARSRTGSYSARLPNGGYIGYDISGTPTEIRVGVAFYYTVNPLNDNMIAFRGNLGTEIFAIDINGAGQLELMRGVNILAVSMLPIRPGSWLYFDVAYKADNAAGVCTVNVNGTQWVTYAGDTIEGSDTSIAEVRFYSGISYIYVDDVVINDTTGVYNNGWTEQNVLHLAKPNAAGDDTDMTPSAGSNYQCVDDIPLDTADYVESSTVTDIDIYNIDDPLVGTENINNIVVNIVSQLDSGSGNLYTAIKSNATYGYGGPFTLSTSWQRFSSIWTLNPGTLAVFTPSDIDALQIGQEVV